MRCWCGNHNGSPEACCVDTQATPASLSGNPVADSVDVAVNILSATDRATYCTDGIQELWLPVSLLTGLSRDAQAGRITYCAPMWLAVQKGFV